MPRLAARMRTLTRAQQLLILACDFLVVAFCAAVVLHLLNNWS